MATAQSLEDLVYGISKIMEDLHGGIYYPNQIDLIGRCAIWSPDSTRNQRGMQALDDFVIKNHDLIPPVLQKLEELQLVNEYIEIFSRFRGAEELVGLVKESSLSQQFRDNIALRINHNPWLVSGEFAELYPNIRHVLDINLSSQSTVCIDLTARFQQKDPSVITFIYDNPNTRKDVHEDYPSWYDYGFFFHKMGTAAIPALLDAMVSSSKPPYLRAHAAAEIREINDPETNKKLIEMLKEDESLVRYAAKALAKSEDSEKIDPFIFHYSKIDYIDWAVGLSTKEAIPKLVETLANPNSTIMLKWGVISLLEEFKNYEAGRKNYVASWKCKRGIKIAEGDQCYKNGIKIPYSAEISEEQYQKILSYFSQRGYAEKDRRTIMYGDGSLNFEKLLIHLKVNGQERGLVDLFNLIRNPSNSQQLRLRVIQRIGKMAHQYYREEKHPIDEVYLDAKDYLGKIGSGLFGWRREPDRELRKAAREAHYCFY